jgi:diguanylate cyclase (GGDEF)-like protein
LCPVLNAAGKVIRVAAFAEDVTELSAALEKLHQANDLLQKMAHTDDLTGLPNRRCFLETLAREPHRINRYGGEAVVGIVDADHFKTLNDTQGHALGDRVLTELAATFLAQVRNSDTVGRYAGDEFVILMPNISTEGAINVIERGRAALRIPLRTRDDAPVSVTFSAGLAPVPQNTTPEAVLHLADLALYEAKTAGRDCTRVSPQLGRKSSGDTQSS